MYINSESQFEKDFDDNQKESAKSLAKSGRMKRSQKSSAVLKNDLNINFCKDPNIFTKSKIVKFAHDHNLIILIAKSSILKSKSVIKFEQLNIPLHTSKGVERIAIVFESDLKSTFVERGEKRKFNSESLELNP